LVAIYLGETDESKIERMSYPFFNKVLHHLNRKLQYDAAIGYAGNSFFKDSGKLINETNPLRGEEERGNSGYGESLAAMLNSGKFNIRIRSREEQEDEYGIVFGKKD